MITFHFYKNRTNNFSFQVIGKLLEKSNDAFYMFERLHSFQLFKHVFIKVSKKLIGKLRFYLDKTYMVFYF